MSRTNLATPAINADDNTAQDNQSIQESPRFIDNTHEDPEMRQSTVTAIPNLEQVNAIAKQESMLSEIESPNFRQPDDAVSNIIQGNTNL